MTVTTDIKIMTKDYLENVMVQKVKMDFIDTAIQNMIPKNVTVKCLTDVTVPNVLVIHAMIAITTLVEAMILLNKSVWDLVKKVLINSVNLILTEITVWLI